MKDEEMNPSMQPEEPAVATDEHDTAKKAKRGPLQIRASLEAEKAFKDLVEKLDQSQGNVFSSLLKAYEMVNAQNQLPDNKAQIEDFRNLTNRTCEAYISLLEMYGNSKNVVRSEFENSLREKDNTILYLTEQQAIMSVEVTTLKDDNTRLTNELAEKSCTEAQLKLEIASISDREKLLVTSFEKAIPKSEQLEATIQELKQEIKNLTDQNKKLETANHGFTEKIQDARQEYLDKAKADMDLLDKARAEVHELSKQVQELKPYYEHYRTTTPQQHEHNAQ